MADREAATELTLGKARCRAGFRTADAKAIAGGPIELTFFVELIGGGTCRLFVTGDRMRQRPGGFAFSTTLAGMTIDDPSAHLPDMGGPAGHVDITADRPWHQPLILNQFARLEAGLEILQPGEAGTLQLRCRRLPASDAPSIEVPLTLALRRDDARLAALVGQLIETVNHGPSERRLPALEVLLSLRARPAVALWRSLASSPDAAVAARVRQALAATAG